MTGVAVAMAEIVREGTWALRALGYPYGTAERAVGMLAWTEAVHGHGLALLRLGEAAIAAGASRPPPRWTRDANGVRRADAAGKFLFECGPPALDLVTADARLNGVGRAVLRGALGTRLTSSLGALAARRGLAAILVHAPGTAEIAPVPSEGWIYALPTPQGPGFLAGGLDEPLPAVLPAPLHVATEDIVAARTDENGYLGIIAVPSPVMALAAGATDWPERLALAYRTGTVADPADHQALYALEMRTWAPTSDRSRAQAGYGRF